jgi:primosomal protein N' (replication factor Y)
MIGKGHDFGSLSLVGVISADTALSFPDFRAAERTFQMLTQVSGRAGRGGASGRVIVQSYNPTHYSIQAAQNHDFQAFCDFELRERRRLLFPPFVNLVRLVLTHSDQARVVRLAHSLASALKRELPVKGKAFELLGPAPAPLYKLKKRFRWHILIKTDDVLETTARLERAFERDFAGDRRLIDVDVDPVSLM